MMAPKLAWPSSASLIKCGQGELVRLIGVGVSGLSQDARQLSLWDEPNEKEERLWEALETLRKRFGDGAMRTCGESLEQC